MSRITIAGSALRPIPPSCKCKNNTGEWMIVEGDHTLYSFGNKEAKPGRALALIHDLGFAYSCYMGRPNPCFRYLRK